MARFDADASRVGMIKIPDGPTVGNFITDGRSVLPYEAAPFGKVECIYTKAQAEAMVAAAIERCAKIAREYPSLEQCEAHSTTGSEICDCPARIADRIREGR